MGKWKTFFSLLGLILLIVLMAAGFCFVTYQIGVEIVKEVSPIVVGFFK